MLETVEKIFYNRMIFKRQRILSLLHYVKVMLEEGKCKLSLNERDDILGDNRRMRDGTDSIKVF